MGYAEKTLIFLAIPGWGDQLLAQQSNLPVPRTGQKGRAEPTEAPPKVAVLTAVQVSDALSAHPTV